MSRVPTQTAVDYILNNVRRQPILPRPQQLHLARLVRTWRDWPVDSPCPPQVIRRGQRAKQQLVATNQALVVSVAKRYRHIWINQPDLLADLIQIGSLGLSSAIDKYDPTRGYALTTYAVPWVRQTIGRYLSSFGLVYFPEHTINNHRKLSRLITDYERIHGVRPSVVWLMEQTGLTRTAIGSAILVGEMKIGSLDRIIDGTNNVSLGDHLASPEPEDTEEYDRQLAALRDAINDLPELEAGAMRAALAGQRMSDYGSANGFSRSWAGHLKQRAIKQLQQQLAPIAA